MNLFGFEIKRYKPAEDIPSIAPKVTDDGAILINTTAGGPLNSGVYLDLEGTVKSESELITKYRDMALHPEIDMAIDEVVNEAIVSEEGEKTVQIILDDVPIDDKIKDILVGEFDEVLKLLDFQTMSYEVFRRWYIDGRLYYLVIIDPKTQSQILELRYLDPRKIRKIKQIAKSKDKKTAAVLSKLDTEYYIYSDKGLMSGPSVQNYNVTSTSNGIKIAKDSIIFVTSGLTNTVGTMVLSYLHKAIKPLNMLRSMEDSCVIYRISRAPERRIFYIDVGNMPRFKAEQYVKDIAASYKNKIVYNAETGTVQDDRRFLTMLDDFFIPRREGGKGTQIDTLPAGCLDMATLVPLLDGRTLSLTEIEKEFNDDKKLWAYSCHPLTGEVVPGLITWAGITQKSADVMKLTLDNGKEIICTPDHKFPVWDKGFVRADELIVNESMISLSKDKNGKNGYERVYQHHTQNWQDTHKLVMNFNEQHALSEEFVYKKQGPKEVRHHKNHNKFNNNPENLVWMSWHDHKKYHADHIPKNFGLLGSKAAAEKLRTNKVALAEHKQNSSNQAIKFHSYLKNNPKAYVTHCDKISLGIKNYFENLSQDEKADRNKINAKNVAHGHIHLKSKMTKPDFRKWYGEQHKKSWSESRRDNASKRMQENNNFWLDKNAKSNHQFQQKIEFDNKLLCAVIDLVKGKTSHEYTIKDVESDLNNNPQILHHFMTLNKGKSTPNWNCQFTTNLVKKLVISQGYQSWSDFRTKESVHNHRIVAIEYMAQKMDVGTLTIDGDEKYHNYHTFGLDVGIFTKNSNLGQIEDIKYFQNKLYSALNVPVGRLNPEYTFDIGRSTQISRDEVKFSKFVDRLRLRFSELFLTILERNLVLKRVLSPDDWDQISHLIKFKFHQDNCFSELKDIEIQTGRYNMINLIQPYIGRFVSNIEIRKQILKQDDKSIQQIDQEIRAEAKNPQYMPPPEEDGKA